MVLEMDEIRYNLTQGRRYYRRECYGHRRWVKGGWLPL